MTCIIGVEDPANHRSVVFSDSGMWRGEHKAELSGPKIWRDGEWIIGMAGGWSCARILRRTPLPCPDSKATELEVTLALGDWSEMVLRKVAEMNTTIRNAEDGAKCDSPSILVARGEFIWDIENCAAARSLRGWESIGMWTYAAGALGALWPGHTPFQAGALAMKAVAEVTSGVMAPYRWLATDGTEGVL